MEKRYPTLRDFFEELPDFMKDGTITHLSNGDATKSNGFWESFFDSYDSHMNFSEDVTSDKKSCRKLKDIPCYPGDTVYYYDKEKDVVFSLKVDSITITEDSTNIVCSKPLFNFFSKETMEKFTFTVKEDFEKRLFTSLNSVVSYDSDFIIASTEFSKLTSNLVNLSLQVLLSKNTPVKTVVKISDETNEQVFMFNNFEDAYKKYSEIKELLCC